MVSSSVGRSSSYGRRVAAWALLAALLAASACDAAAAPVLFSSGAGLRQRVAEALIAQQGSRQLAPSSCQAVAFKLLPPPALVDYHRCYEEKLEANSSHDWSIPGAQLAAQTACWCQANMTPTVDEFGCCDHNDFFPMCTVDCDPDCGSELAKTCVQECPSMCFEAAEYVIEKGLCSRCDWPKCWPVLQCMTQHAEARIEKNELDRTCHESNFLNGDELADYWRCWRDAPKHSSHWNVLSSVVHCSCRENMVAHVRENHCCDSSVYGGGVCEVACFTEAQCGTQEAQTCIQRCQRICESAEATPSRECTEQCLGGRSPCRNFTSCRPPAVSSHICDDGRWPEASSGCCAMNRTDGAPGVVYGCPKMCEAESMWRVDGGRSMPWWSRWQPGHGVVAQCSCRGCPETTEDRLSKLDRTLEDSVWDNGQMMLVDIARREGLRFGPTRRMQELMALRNEKIVSLRRGLGGADEAAAARINDRFVDLITAAAREGDDERAPSGPGPSGDANGTLYLGLLCAAATVFVAAVIVSLACILGQRTKTTPVVRFDGGADVVMGNPVVSISDGEEGLATGAPVFVRAPTKPASAQPAACTDVTELT